MLRYTVEDMTCAHCVQTITKAIEAVAPGNKIAIDLSTKLVEMDGTADGRAVENAIRDAGYTPTPAESSAGADCCGHCH